MTGLEIDVKGLEGRGVIAEIPQGLKLDLIYNKMDSFIYVAILDRDEKIVVGHSKLVPNINLLSLTDNDYKFQIRCVKINDYAEEIDKITIANLNHDYKFFIIGDENEVV